MTVENLAERIQSLSDDQRLAFRRELGRIANEDRLALVAYVKTTADRKLDTEKLRQFLATQLPEYMIPSQFVQIASLPRLANGKIDRKQLPHTVAIGHVSEQSVESQPQSVSASSDALESKLAALWARNLNMDYVLPDDDFFELGGHSLLGVQLLLDVKDEFGVEIPLADLFDASRLKDMVARIRCPGDAPRVVATIQPGKDLTPIFAVHGGDRTLAAAFGPDRPLYLVFDSISTTSADVRSVETIADYYLQGVRQIQPDGPYILCGYSFGGMIAYEMAMRLTKAGETVHLVGTFDSTPPDVGRWGLGIRLQQLLFRLGDHPGLLNKARFLIGSFIRKVWRRMRAPFKFASEAPQTHDEIQLANVKLYIDIGFRYRYPMADLNCVVYMPEHHPLWVKYLTRKWQRVVRGSLSIECVEGAREHSDMTRPPYDAWAAQSFAAHVSSVERSAQGAHVRPRLS